MLVFLNQFLCLLLADEATAPHQELLQRHPPTFGIYEDFIIEPQPQKISWRALRDVHDLS